jgi:uncharacterized protein YutE (UPF0331/DUF86 family)
MQPDDAYLEKEFSKIETVLSLMEELTGRKDWSMYERIAMGTLLQNAYSGLEGLFRSLLAERNASLPKSEKWHVELLQLAREHGFIPEQIFPEMKDLLYFRHVHVHGYGHMLREERLRELAFPSIVACRSVVANLRSL